MEFDDSNTNEEKRKIDNEFDDIWVEKFRGEDAVIERAKKQVEGFDLKMDDDGIVHGPFGLKMEKRERWVFSRTEHLQVPPNATYNNGAKIRMRSGKVFGKLYKRPSYIKNILLYMREAGKNIAWLQNQICHRYTCEKCDLWDKDDGYCVVEMLRDDIKKSYDVLYVALWREVKHKKYRDRMKRNFWMRTRRRKKAAEKRATERKKNKVKAKLAPKILKKGDFDFKILEEPRRRFKLPVYLWKVRTGEWITCSDKGVLDIARPGDLVVGKAYNRWGVHELFTVKHMIMSEFEDENKKIITDDKWKVACKNLKYFANKGKEGEK